jgi:hypothetical protein
MSRLPEAKALNSAVVPVNWLILSWPDFGPTVGIAEWAGVKIPAARRIVSMAKLKAAVLIRGR